MPTLDEYPKLIRAAVLRHDFSGAARLDAQRVIAYAGEYRERNAGQELRERPRTARELAQAVASELRAEVEALGRPHGGNQPDTKRQAEIAYEATQLEQAIRLRDEGEAKQRDLAANPLAPAPSTRPVVTAERLEAVRRQHEHLLARPLAAMERAKFLAEKGVETLVFGTLGVDFDVVDAKGNVVPAPASAGGAP